MGEQTSAINGDGCIVSQPTSLMDAVYTKPDSSKKEAECKVDAKTKPYLQAPV